jgi:sensor histidine kinase YesM
MDAFFTRLVLSNDFNPRVSRHLLFWTLAWIYQGLLYSFLYVDGPSYQTFAISFSEALIYLPQHIFLSYSIIYFVLPLFIFRSQYWTGIFIIFVLIIITALISPVTLLYVIKPFREWMGFPYMFKGVGYAFLGGLRGSMTIAGFAVAIKLVKHWYLKKSENEQLEKARLRAELELLKGQLHPHFMFNTLNSIYATALRDSSATAEGILRLANLMRYMIAESGAPAIALSKEIHILNNYMQLEKSRIGNRLDQSFHVEGDMNGKSIAPLLLLPFVENSYKHGVYENAEEAWVNLDISVKDAELHFKLVNGKANGGGKYSTGTGLLNVRKRLSLLYPDGYDLRITEDSDTYIVSLTLMLNRLSIPV